VTLKTTPAARRAAPMAPDERRASIIEAVLPLVYERGVDITTRELAAAAGVAEGTLFRVFDDKSALLSEVAIEGLRRITDPEETRAELAKVDRSAPLEERLTQVIELGRRRTSAVFGWVGVLRALHKHAGEPTPQQQLRAAEMRETFQRQNAAQRAATEAALTALLASDARRLRVPVPVAVTLIESAVVGQHMRTGLQLPPVSSSTIADVLVHGLVVGGPTFKRLPEEP
jgi:AcrR family transcriptional regulator